MTTTTIRARAPALYIITDRHATSGRALVEVVRRALDGIAMAGADGAAVAVQLREKDLEAADLLYLAQQLRAVTAAVGAGLYINDRIDVAVAAGADGVHLGGGSLTPAEAGAIAPELAVAVSTHAAADVARAAGQPNVRFAVLGPVFDTPSKRRYGAPLGTTALAAAARFPLPVLALGGVTLQNVASCLADGARGIACIRAVMADPDPAPIVAALLKSIFTYRRIHYPEDLT